MSEKTMKVYSDFQEAIKTGDHSQINKYSGNDLNQAKNELIRAKDHPYYQLILDKISEKNKKEERRNAFIKGIVVATIGGIVVLILSHYILQFIFK